MTDTGRTLYGYWRSSAAYRTRIALGLKGLAYDAVVIDLRTGEQAEPAFKAINPQGFVPFLVDGDAGMSQSLAIIEYLEEVYPEPPLLPAGAAERARVRALALTVACDIHPLNNLRVLKHLENDLGLDKGAVNAWARRWIEAGFDSLEQQAADPYLTGDTVTLADICLVPQMYNARRVETDLSRFPKLLAIEARLQALPAFAAARPEVQPEAVPV